jgi:hypothetical protein
MYRLLKNIQKQNSNLNFGIFFPWKFQTSSAGPWYQSYKLFSLANLLWVKHIRTINFAYTIAIQTAPRPLSQHSGLILITIFMITCHSYRCLGANYQCLVKETNIQSICICIFLTWINRPVILHFDVLAILYEIIT